MTKSGRGELLNLVQTVSRLSRTDLATRLLQHGFYAGQDQIMLLLDEQDGQTPGSLSERLGVRPPTITKTITRLQSQGFVRKASSKTDGRQTLIYLTDSGRNAIKAISKAVRRTEKQALKNLDKKDQKVLARLLSEVEQTLMSNAENG